MSDNDFHIRLDASALALLRSRIRGFEWPYNAADSGWRYGCDPDFLRRFCIHWADSYDIEAGEGTLNRYPQLLAEVAPGMRLHVVHVCGEAQGRRPLLLIHGWPGSVYQFWPLIDALAFPSRFGGAPMDAFDVVIPSLPGYGYSDKPAAPVGPRATAGWLARLMRDALGYQDYLVAGTDWGVVIAAWLALDHRKDVRGIHIDYPGAQPAAAPTTDAERAYLEAFEAAENRLGAYSRLHATRPQSLAFLAAGNPVAQAAWILERFHDWADLRGRAIDEVFSLDTLITNLMLTVMTDSFGSATWMYAGAESEGARRLPEGCRVPVPAGFASFPDPRHPRPPRSWVEKGYDVVHWREHDRGGHFASMEVPDLVIADLRDWAASLANIHRKVDGIVDPENKAID